MGYKAKTEAVHDLLSRDIMNGTFPPGKPLRIAALADHYGTGTKPLREALTRLEEQKLVVAIARHRWQVAAVSKAEFNDLQFARRALETALVKDTVEHGGLEWETDLVAAHYRLTQAVAPRGEADSLAYRQTWIAMHDAFHAALLAGAQSVWAKRFYAQVLTQLQRHYQAALVREKTASKESKSLMDIALSVPPHTELMVALLDRDATSATALLEAHSEVSQHIFSAIFDGTAFASSAAAAGPAQA